MITSQPSSKGILNLLLSAKSKSKIEYSLNGFLLPSKELAAKVIEKESGVVIRSFGLAPKERTKIYISKTNTVYFENENKVDVKVDVILSKGVEGMRYVDNK